MNRPLRQNRFAVRPGIIHAMYLALLVATLIVEIPWASMALAQSTGPSSTLTAGPTYTSGDDPSNHSASMPEFPMVDIVFTLIGRDGNPIPTHEADLKLSSQGKEIATAFTIRPFDQTGHGITAILAIDASGSMKGAPLAAIHASIAKFVNQARPQDKVEVVTFADQTQVDVPFGASQSALARELQSVQARGRFTHLWDGLLDALAQFTADQPKRRQIVVISDGHDEGSKHAMTDVVFKARSLGVVIDSIGLTRDAGEYLGLLQQVSQQTGGSYHRAQDAPALEGLIGQGIQVKRSSPVASFKTRHLAADDKLHAVQLRWQPGNLFAPAFVKTPKAPLVDNLWICALGGCFVAGVVLLIFSFYGSRRKPPAMASSRAPLIPLVAPTNTTSPDSPSRHAPTSFESGTVDLKNPSLVRAETLIEGSTAPVPHAAPPKSTSTAERTRTQLAIFFEAASNGDLARLVVISGSFAGQTVAVTAPVFAIGAIAGNQFILPDDSTVSAHHARLLWESSILKIEDTESTNGTYLNEQRLAAGRQLLRPGDQIRLGQTVLIVHRA